MQKFWNWVKNEDKRTLYLNGAISETSWFDDDVTPALFKSELEDGEGDIDLWINSPGGDCFAAAQIYNMISNYKGKVTVFIDGLAASAASVIAMAGDEVIMSPVSMLMIHNPSTVAFGEAADMEKVIAMLGEVKDSIINAYVAKTGLSRAKLSRLMDDETWMNANKAVELGFADCVKSHDRGYEAESKAEDISVEAMMFSQKKTDMYVTNLLTEKYGANNARTTPDNVCPKDTPSVKDAENSVNGIDNSVNSEKEKSDKVSETEVKNNTFTEKSESFTGRTTKNLKERMELIKNFLGGK